MQPTLYSQTWELDSLFPGGSASLAFHHMLHTLEKDTASLQHEIGKAADLGLLVLRLQTLESQLVEAEAFVGCLLAQYVQDPQAVQLNDRLASLRASIETLITKLDAELVLLDEEDFMRLLGEDHLKEIAFQLHERYQAAKEKLSVKQEKIIHQLAVNGYKGWQELYQTIMGTLRIPFEQAGATQQLAVAQFENKLSHPDRTIRCQAFERWEKTWQEQEEMFAQILNHLAGFRLKVYHERQWDSILKEPLFYNRMQASTLDAMWNTIRQSQAQLLPYIHAKARLLGIEQLAWYDLEAPLPVEQQTFIAYDEAAEMVVKNFKAFSPKMGHFAQEAFARKWIETEDRPGKAPGGFCSQHPLSKQSRIFMTYSGMMPNVFTLAHELGHAYHNEAVKDLPFLAQQYRMNVAETASTFAEMVTIDALIQHASSTDLKRSLLDSKLQRSVVFLMNIQARFLFESRFYEKREQGFVLAQELNTLMEQAQKEAYNDALSTWHPHFWVAKRHFYMTEVPFYNFPYTFGYLFSLGLYARAQQEGTTFAHRYEDLLQDTGKMTTEELAFKHLGVDLTQPEFWQQGLDLIYKDVQGFVQLAL